MQNSTRDAAGRQRSLRPLAGLLPYLGRYCGHVAAAVLALTAAALATLAVPLAVRRMIDFGFGSADARLVNSYFAALFAVAAALALASAARYYFVTWLGERIVADLRADVFAHVIGLDMRYFDATRTGDIVSRLTADTTQIKAAVGASASIALRNLLLFIGAVVMMVVTSPRLSGFVLVAIPFIVVPIVAFGRRVRARSRHAQDTLAEASAFAAEAVASVRTIQAFTAEAIAGSRFGTLVERAFEAARASTFARALLTGLAIFIVFASVVAVLWIGAHDVLAGRLTPGALGQFVLYSVFAAGALGELSQVWGEVSLAAGAAERLFEMLALAPAVTAPAKPAALLEPGKGSLAFEGVSFRYDSEGEASVLEDLTFSVRPGETVALVGPSGAGKSTVFALLLRYYDPAAGRITLDGVPLRDADPREVRRRIAVVPQETTIFAASIAENIRFGRPDASNEEVRRAGEAALVDAFARELPDGYDTLVGERGVTLSGGERQRIAIARALLKDAPVLLLDEATSALDAESETAVQTALEHLMKNRTTLVIAHRLATVLKADRILVLDRGRLVETGSHQALVQAGGLYSRLARLQFQNAAEALAAATKS